MLTNRNHLKALIHFLSFVIFSLVLLVVFSRKANSINTIQCGSTANFFINLSNQDNGFFVLQGEMEFYWNRLLSPADFENNDSLNISKNLMLFPKTWNMQNIDGEEIPGRGYATYRADLIFDTICPMAFKIKDYCNSYNLWLNGELISGAGNTGRDKASTTSVKVNAIVPFTPIEGANEFVLQTSNFYEKYGGFRQPFLIGSYDDVHRYSKKIIMIDAFLIGFLILAILYHTVIFLLNPRKKSFLYFSLLVFVILLRQFLLSDVSFQQNSLEQFVPAYLKINIISAVSASLLVLLLFRHEYPGLIKGKPIKLYAFVIALFVVFTVFAPIFCVSVGIHYFQFFVITMLFYLLFLSIKSFFIKGAKRLTAIGLLIFLLTVIVEAMIFNRMLYSGYVLHYGIIAFVLFESYALASDYSRSHLEKTNMAETLRIQNQNLHEIVAQKTKEAIEANERELFSVIQQKNKSYNIINNILSKLKKVAEDGETVQVNIEQITRSVEQSIETDETSNHLLHFRKINPAFIERLEKIHPDLTHNEIKLCCYLKLNLSHKEVASILHVMPESVRKAKSRMRQKMGLESDNELIYYLRNI